MLNLENPALYVICDLIIIGFFCILKIKPSMLFRDNKCRIEAFFYDSIKNVKISFKDTRHSIVYPIVIIVIFFCIIRFFFLQPANYDISFLIIIKSVIAAPIAEEILQCLFLSMVLIGSKCVFKGFSINETNSRKYGIQFLAVLASAIIMIFLHDANRVITTFFCFTIYGSLYYLNDRNIVPPVIAHGTWNLLVILDSVVN